MNMASALLCTKQVAAKLNCSRRTIERLVKAGRLGEVYYLGNQIRIPSENLELLKRKPGKREGAE
ncbi:MAG: helix-turn-helix domain-containing protein [Rhizobiales bacterium]|nr:helix-turn-helix domain-containing protein [Hyphomicrobiales bacterium]